MVKRYYNYFPYTVYMKIYRYSLLELNTYKSKPETDIHHS
jgi:hypothetical protein